MVVSLVLSGMQLTENSDFNNYSSIHGSSSSSSVIGGDSSSIGDNIYNSYSSGSGGGQLNSAHHVGFNLRNLPVALGLICFCFGGHGTL